MAVSRSWADTDSLLLFLLVASGIAVWIRARRRTRGAAPSGRAALETVPRSLKLYQFRNVIVPDGRGTTEIDLILVGNTGIFVVEVKEYNAWIFGSEGDERWTARYTDGSTFQFQNPVRQNYRHMMALVEHLHLPQDRFHPLVVFYGNCEMKTRMPPTVLVGGYEDKVRWTSGIRLTEAEVHRACEVLQDLESKSTSDAFEEHVEKLQARFSSDTTCPKCGSPLVERRSTKPTSDGMPFLGCRAYPKCTYTRGIHAA